jgi:hypothetical protein
MLYISVTSQVFKNNNTSTCIAFMHLDILVFPIFVLKVNKLFYYESGAGMFILEPSIH